MRPVIPSLLWQSKNCAAPVAKMNRVYNRMLAMDCKEGSENRFRKASSQSSERHACATLEIRKCVHLKAAESMMRAKALLGQTRMINSFRISVSMGAGAQPYAKQSERIGGRSPR